MAIFTECVDGLIESSVLIRCVDIILLKAPVNDCIQIQQVDVRNEMERQLSIPSVCSVEPAKNNILT